MAYGDIETIYQDGQWINRAEQVGVLSTHDDRQTAIAVAAQIARRRHLKHRVREPDGTIVEMSDYRRSDRRRDDGSTSGP